MQKRPGLGAVAALCVGVAGCGYPSFQFGPAGTGGSASASSSQASASSQAASSSGGTGGRMTSGSSSTATVSSSSSSTASSTGGLAPCGIGHLVISDIQTSGKNGASDEFVTLYNPTENPITIDAAWMLKSLRLSSPPGSYQTRWTGGGGPASIPARGHYLIVGSSYSGATEPDDALSSSIVDEASLVLYVNGAPIDAVCYYNLGTDPTEFGVLYTCAGMPVYNPQDGSTSAMIDRSIARKPGSAMGSCTDSNDNALDFTVESPSTPENTASPPN